MSRYGSKRKQAGRWRSGCQRWPKQVSAAAQAGVSRPKRVSAAAQAGVSSGPSGCHQLLKWVSAAAQAVSAAAQAGVSGGPSGCQRWLKRVGMRLKWVGMRLKWVGMRLSGWGCWGGGALSERRGLAAGGAGEQQAMRSSWVAAAASRGVAGAPDLALAADGVAQAGGAGFTATAQAGPLGLALRQGQGGFAQGPLAASGVPCAWPWRCGRPRARSGAAASRLISARIASCDCEALARRLATGASPGSAGSGEEPGRPQDHRRLVHQDAVDGGQQSGSLPKAPDRVAARNTAITTVYSRCRAAKLCRVLSVAALASALLLLRTCDSASAWSQARAASQIRPQSPSGLVHG